MRVVTEGGVGSSGGAGLVPAVLEHDADAARQLRLLEQKREAMTRREGVKADGDERGWKRAKRLAWERS